MDEETRQYLEAMEARLMSRITGAQGALIELIERIRSVEASVAVLTELARSTNTLLGTLAGLMVDVGRRVTDLEKKA
jgi:hypothetical protein